MNTVNGATITGFLVLFLLYQLAEASGQGLLRLPKRLYSTFALFIMVIIAAIFVAYILRIGGLSAFHMELRPGWWQGYLLGLAAGLLIEALFELIGVKLGIREVCDLRLHIRSLAGSFL